MWKKYSVKELREVAKAYKEHLSIGAPSKMTKKELIAVLDKHLRIEEGTNKIYVRATELAELQTKKSKGEKEAKEIYKSLKAKEEAMSKMKKEPPASPPPESKMPSRAASPAAAPSPPPAEMEEEKVSPQRMSLYKKLASAMTWKEMEMEERESLNRMYKSRSGLPSPEVLEKDREIEKYSKEIKKYKDTIGPISEAEKKNTFIKRVISRMNK